MTPRSLLIVATAWSYLTPSALAMHPAAKASNEFCFSLLRVLSRAPDDVVFSPVSLWSMLALVSTGAEGETRQQMHRALALDALSPQPADGSHEQRIGLPYGDASTFVSEWLSEMKNVQGGKMNVVNRLWATSAFHFKPEFVATESAYATSHGPLDLAKGALAAAALVNQWVREQTDGNIRSSMSADAIKADAQPLVTSHFSIAGKWASPFDARRGTRTKFTLLNAETIEVESIAGDVPAGYFEDDRLQALRLRFDGMAASMIIVQPRRADAISQPSFLSMNQFMVLLATFKDEPHVMVQLPAFSATPSRDFSADLKALGMKRAFTPDAEFGLLGGPRSSLGGIVHQVAMTVVPSGVASVLATVDQREVPTASSPTTGAKRFIVTHPFLFFIVDDTNSGIVVAGRIAHPIH